MIKINRNAVFVHLGVEHETAILWFFTDDSDEIESNVRMLLTGDALPDLGAYRYLGTVHIVNNTMALHVFLEQLPSD